MILEKRFRGIENFMIRCPFLRNEKEAGESDKMDVDDVLRKIEEMEGEREASESDDEDLFRAYGIHGAEELKTMRGAKTERSKKIVMYLQLIHVHPELAENFFKLGHMLGENETVRSRKGEMLNRQRLWVLGLKADPNNPLAYYNLARLLNHAEDTVVMWDDRVLSKKDLCVESLRCRLGQSDVLHYLGTLLRSKDEKIKLSNGEEVNRTTLNVMAIQANASEFRAYSAIADDMTATEEEEVVDFGKGPTTKRTLYALAIHHGPKDPRAYVNLGTLLKFRESFKLLNGKFCTNQDLYEMALKLDPLNYKAMYNLAITLRRDEEVVLPDGISYNRVTMLVRVIDLHPSYKKALNALAYSLKKTEKIAIRIPGQDEEDPRVPVSKRELYALGGVVFNLPKGMEEEAHVEMKQIVEEVKKKKPKKKKKKVQPVIVTKADGTKVVKGVPKPKEPVVVPCAPGTRERLIRFFTEYAPEKLGDVDKLLEHFGGREESRFAILVNLYGPEPPSEEVIKSAVTDALAFLDDDAPPPPPIMSSSSLSVFFGQDEEASNDDDETDGDDSRHHSLLY